VTHGCPIYLFREELRSAAVSSAKARPGALREDYRALFAADPPLDCAVTVGLTFEE
jgi:hypothetical protein